MMNTEKEIQSLGMPWEKEFGYAQAVRMGRMVWLAGQVGHDDKGILAEGMDAQMNQAYANIKKLLAGFDMTMDNVMEEVFYVLDTNSAFEAGKKLRKNVYANPMEIANTTVAVNGLVLPNQLIEIKITAKK
jgi:2-iminobutanoate/2-iminopropanoate deaminase